MTVADKPAYPYRGAMIDLARKYHSPGGMKQVIELCRQYKIRYLHVHLSDDQLFMFPSTKFPRPARATGSSPGSSPAQSPRSSRTRATSWWTWSGFRRRGACTSCRKSTCQAMPAGWSATSAKLRLPGYGSTLNIASPKTLEAAATLLERSDGRFPGHALRPPGRRRGGPGRFGEHARVQGSSEAVPDIKSAHDLYCKFMRDMHGVFAKRGKKMIVWEEACNPGGPFPLPKDTFIMVWCQGRTRPTSSRTATRWSTPPGRRCTSCATTARRRVPLQLGGA